jgi:hypothetical protein
MAVQPCRWYRFKKRRFVSDHEGIKSASMGFVTQKLWRAYRDSEEMMLLQEKEKEKLGPSRWAGDGAKCVRLPGAVRKGIRIAYYDYEVRRYFSTVLSWGGTVSSVAGH